jgi:hypothetical protein
MKIISHRGNLNGPSVDLENNPTHINKVIEFGYDVEIDLWFKNKKFYLGHDEPIYQIDKYWLLNKKNYLWIHLKNIEALEIDFLNTLNYFWHESDKLTLTSKGIPWCYPGIYVKNGITVVQDNSIVDKDILGICTDYPQLYGELK